MGNSIEGIGSISTMWLIPPDWAKEVSTDFEFSRILLKYPGTALQVISENEKVPMKIEYQFSHFNKTEENTFLSFFVDRQGRLKKFWIPTWVNRFELVSNMPTASTYLPTKNVHFKVLYGGYERFFIEFHNGDLLTRQIVSITDVSETVTNLVFTTPLDRDVNIADINIFGLFLLVRFDIDKCRFGFFNTKTSKSIVRVKELIREYPS